MAKNPFKRNPCGHCDVSLVVPVGSYAGLDIFDAMTTIDERLENGDVLGARQVLWSVGRTLYAELVLDIDQVDDLVIEHATDVIVDEIEAETED